MLKMFYNQRTTTRTRDPVALWDAAIAASESAQRRARRAASIAREEAAVYARMRAAQERTVSAKEQPLQV